MRVAKPTAIAPRSAPRGRGAERARDRADDHERCRCPTTRDHAARSHVIFFGVSRRATPSGRHARRAAATPHRTRGQERHRHERDREPLPADPQLADAERGALERQQRAQRQQHAVEHDAEDRTDEPLPGGLGDGQADHLARRRAEQPQRRQAGVPTGDPQPGGGAAERDQRDDEQDDGDPREDHVDAGVVVLTLREPGSSARAVKPSRPPTTLSVRPVVTANAVIASPS